jgi:hypothetical protein
VAVETGLPIPVKAPVDASIEYTETFDESLFVTYAKYFDVIATGGFNFLSLLPQATRIITITRLSIPSHRYFFIVTLLIWK